ncbi:hypothetical protein AIOL_001523 [Candidatus Rhodobacter oscarellae]|uniref:Sulfotransferase family protein n=2 Tax=Candidatus Rhodobacter oscarellae TaxID=1675527 RepID=A0A0J9E3Z8_9RHOB|nr:hypothetical protein AIOL_001523 [Candidatus Rhodobacter lobularis]
MSNGRCGTQFLARQMGALADTEVVVHEAMSHEFGSRAVFRSKRAQFEHVGRVPAMQRHLIHIEHFTNQDRRYIHFGWQAFAWVNYFHARFPDRFAFIHLVRNPYHCAASHATHQRMVDNFTDPFARSSKIFGYDPKVACGDFAERSKAFNIFERQLFNWLEVTRYGLDCGAELPSFQGLYRFEDVCRPDGGDLDDLLTRLMGREVSAQAPEPFDRVHRASPWPLEFSVDPALKAQVDALAKELGYAQEALDAASDPEALRAKYSAPRYDELPCDPSVPVVVRK